MSSALDLIGRIVRDANKARDAINKAAAEASGHGGMHPGETLDAYWVRLATTRKAAKRAAPRLAS